MPTLAPNPVEAVPPAEVMPPLADTAAGMANDATPPAILDGTLLASPEDPARTEYVDKALLNLQATSRTAAGTIDTSASATKASSMVEGLDSSTIAETATTNFAETIAQLYDMREVAIESPARMREFVEAVAKQVNGGLLKEGQLVRDGADSDKYPYTRLADLEASMDEFYTSFTERLQDPNTDPVELAAWVEYRVDLTDHFFADGCGKTAKALSSWVLMRSGNQLPTYRGRAELYANAPRTIRGTDAATTQSEEKAWLDYYKTLF